MWCDLVVLMAETVASGPARWEWADCTRLYRSLGLTAHLVVALSAVAFAWRRRRLYQDSPIARRFLGVPAIAVIGFLSIGVYLLFMIPLLVNDDLGANATPGVVAMVVIAVLPFLIYGASYFWNRRRGVDLGLAFRELPPE